LSQRSHAAEASGNPPEHVNYSEESRATL